MKLPIEIRLLADHPEHISLLSHLWLNELGRQWIPNASVERAEKTYQEHLNKNNLPLTFVALYENQPIGMASLRDNDGIRDDLTPWLGSVIVHPDFRKCKVGEQLIDITLNQAKKMGYEKIYLLALDPNIPTWYERLGWKYIAMDKLYHHPVTVMEKTI